MGGCVCCLAQLLLLDAPSNHCLGGGRGVQPGKPRRPPLLYGACWSLVFCCCRAPRRAGGGGWSGRTDSRKERARAGWLAGPAVPSCCSVFPAAHSGGGSPDGRRRVTHLLHQDARRGGGHQQGCGVGGGEEPAARLALRRGRPQALSGAGRRRSESRGKGAAGPSEGPEWAPRWPLHRRRARPSPAPEAPLPRPACPKLAVALRLPPGCRLRPKRSSNSCLLRRKEGRAPFWPRRGPACLRAEGVRSRGPARCCVAGLRLVAAASDGPRPPWPAPGAGRSGGIRRAPLRSKFVVPSVLALVVRTGQRVLNATRSERGARPGSPNASSRSGPRLETTVLGGSLDGGRAARGGGSGLRRGGAIPAAVATGAERARKPPAGQAGRRATTGPGACLLWLARTRRSCRRWPPTSPTSGRCCWAAPSG